MKTRRASWGVIYSSPRGMTPLEIRLQVSVGKSQMHPQTEREDWSEGSRTVKFLAMQCDQLQTVPLQLDEADEKGQGCVEAARIPEVLDRSAAEPARDGYRKDRGSAVDPRGRIARPL